MICPLKNRKRLYKTLLTTILYAAHSKENALAIYINIPANRNWLSAGLFLFLFDEIHLFFILTTYHDLLQACKTK
jgi:hypothetical protein